MLLNIKCVFSFSLQLLSGEKKILKRNERGTIIRSIGLHVKYQLFFSDFDGTWIFWTHFAKNIPISNLIKIRLVVDELFRADGRTDMKLVVAFRGFANASEIETHLRHPPKPAVFASYCLRMYWIGGPDSVVCIGGGEIFRTHPDRPRDPSSFLFKVYRFSFLEVKRQRRDTDHPSPSTGQLLNLLK